MSNEENYYEAPSAPLPPTSSSNHTNGQEAAHKAAQEPADQPVWLAEDDAAARPFAPTAHRIVPDSDAAGKRRPLVWLGVAAMAALAVAAGYEMLKPSSPQRLEAGLAAGKERDEPLAMSTPLPRIPVPASTAISAGASASLPSSPSSTPTPAAATVGSEATAVATLAPQLAPTSATVPPQSTAGREPTPASAPSATPGTALTSLGAHRAPLGERAPATLPSKDDALAALQARLDQLTTALRDQGYLKPGARLDDLGSDALLPYPRVLAMRAPAVARQVLVSADASRPVRRQGSRAVATSRVPPRKVTASVAAAHSQPPAAAAASPTTGVQLMAVDLWNGTPSVVIGTTTPGDARIKVMQPGDVVNGVQLRHAQAEGQWAIFGVRGSADSVSLVVGQ